MNIISRTSLLRNPKSAATYTPVIVKLMDERFAIDAKARTEKTWITPYAICLQLLWPDFNRYGRWSSKWPLLMEA